jgi:hypothetical protein
MLRKLSTVLLVTMLVLTAFAPAAATAQETTGSTIDLTLTQDPATGDATLRVTNGSGGVVDATVNVSSTFPYAGNGTYTTDANGTVALPEPAETVGVDVTVTANGMETTDTFTLVPREDSLDAAITQNDDGTALVTVTQYGEIVAGAEVDVSSTVAYAGNGTYTTDANGTVALPEPEQTTEATAVVTSDDVETIESSTVEPIAEFEVMVTSADDGSATVSVTRDDEAVDNATATVSSDLAYAGNGTYTTDANGTVALPEPGQETTVMVTAEDGDDTATMDVQLSPVDTGLAVDVVQQSDGSATVTVTDDGAAVENASVNVTAGVAYEGTGEYDSGVDGTAELPNPEQNLTVTVTATNGSENVTTTAELDSIENGGYANFGQWISSYIERLRTGGYFGPGFGREVSDFATENNPGAEQKPDHAGPPDDVEATDDDETNATDEDEDTRGPPDHAKQGDGSEDAAAEDGEDDERGPPEHAKDKRKQDTDDETEEEETEEDETEEEETEEDETEEEEEGETENDDDSPGNSSDRGDRGNGAGNGGGNGNGRGK